jgi:hypothetical protein
LVMKISSYGFVLNQYVVLCAWNLHFRGEKYTCCRKIH